MTSLVANSIVCLLALSLGPAAASRFEPTAFLRVHCGFGELEIEKLARRVVIVKPLKAEAEEVAICGAMVLAIPSAYYVDRFRRIESFKKTDEVKAIGRFPGDLSALPLEIDEVKDLRACRLHNCGLKLDAAGIAPLAALDRRGAEADERIKANFREYLARYAERYLREGNGALMEYADGDHPASVSRQLHEILAASPYLDRESPSLRSALAAFDGSAPAGIDHFLYWSQEAFGRKPVTSITHALITQPREGGTAIATKQIYASHYFNASLGLTFLADSGAAPEQPRTTVIYVNRSKVDAFGGILGRLARRIVRSRAQSGAERMLEDLRQRLEREYAAQK